MISIRKENFHNLHSSILKSYSELFKEKYSNNNLFTEIFKNDESVNLEQLKIYAESVNDFELKSILYRIIGVSKIIDSRENNTSLELNNVWKYISESILSIPTNYTISSIGSQGFLSIPLYKNDLNLEEFDFIRLHIWDKSLDKYMNLEKCEMFSIHTHTFYAKSWVITGDLINERFEFKENSKNSRHSFFKVEYNKSLNKVNRHTSVAINENINVEITRTSKEYYSTGKTYEIEAGELHKSKKGSDSILATFFSFTGKDGLSKSLVVGPKEIKESEVNRKELINPIELLNRISNKLKND